MFSKILIFYGIVIFFNIYSIISIYAFSLQYYGNTQHKELPNHCYHEEYDFLVPLNETIYPTNLKYLCVKVFCRDDYVLILKYCDRFILHGHCSYTPHDYTKPYPDCCPIIDCNQNDTYGQRNNTNKP